ncbi:DegV family protein [Clostridium culturomicium]|uniref:DegV family protein n=1 Tax=Clostridium culturomicium TaxID=1499683 RepID=UPI00058D26B2|nr:DegV family protein [Clostridium culturomicium]
MSIRIITDSTSDIPQNQAKERNLTIVPLCVRFGDEEFKDGVTLSSEDFYKRLEASKILPVTSQPSPNEFLNHFEEAKAANDEVIVITLSSTLSGTYQSAMLAKSMCEYDKIHVIDSETVTLSLKILIDYAVKLRNEGLSFEELISELETSKKRIKLFAVVGTLEYLKKGGRLSSTAAIAGTLLGIKPIVKVEDGSVLMAAKARGTNSAFNKISSLIEENGGIDMSMPYTLGYSGSPESLDAFKPFIEKAFNLSNSPISIIGSTVGVHAGPGACGIAYFAPNK